MIEKRAMAGKVELRAEGESEARKIAGYAAVFNVETELWPGFREVIRPGAFTKTLGEANVRALFDHDSSQLLGTTRAGTLRLVEDAGGLAYEVDPPDTQIGRDVTELLRRGDLYGSSFAFEVFKEARSYANNGESELREVLEVKLYDVGPVTYPQYEDAKVSLRDLRTFLTSASSKAVERSSTVSPSDACWQREAMKRRLILAALE